MSTSFASTSCNAGGDPRGTSVKATPALRARLSITCAGIVPGPHDP